MKEHNISDKAVTPKAVQNLISRSKDKLITPDKFSTKGKNGSDDYQLSTAKTIYTDYQARLEAANALDFDDIIMLKSCLHIVPMFFRTGRTDLNT